MGYLDGYRILTLFQWFLSSSIPQIDDDSITYTYKTRSFSFPIAFSSVSNSTLLTCHTTSSRANNDTLYGTSQIGVVRYMNYDNQYRISIVDRFTQHISTEWSATILGLGW